MCFEYVYIHFLTHLDFNVIKTTGTALTWNIFALTAGSISAGTAKWAPRFGEDLSPLTTEALPKLYPPLYSTLRDVCFECVYILGEGK